jgi:hypothetical protein
MEKEQLKRIFEFLEDKEEHNAPFIWKWENNIPLTKKDLNIKGNFSLERSKVKSLPEGLKVGGDLDLNGSINITSLPKDLKVGGILWLLGCDSITSLPEGLKVGGALDLRFTKVTSLPKGLEVESFLVIGNTKLTKYSDDELREMIKPGFIKGKIYR